MPKIKPEGFILACDKCHKEFDCSKQQSRRSKRKGYYRCRSCARKSNNPMYTRKYEFICKDCGVKETLSYEGYRTVTKRGYYQCRSCISKQQYVDNPDLGNIHGDKMNEYYIDNPDAHSIHSKSYWDSMEDQERSSRNKQPYIDDPMLSKFQGKRLLEDREKWFNSLSPEAQQEHITSHLNSLHTGRDRYYEGLSKEDLMSRSKVATEGYFKWLNGMTDAQFFEYNNKRLAKTGGKNNLHKKFEKWFEESYISNQFHIYPEYRVIVEGIPKRWDYVIYDKVTNELAMVVDLDGRRFHGDYGDYDGIHGKEEYDERRYQFIPNGVKLCIIYEESFSNSFDYMIKQLVLNYDEFIEEQFKTCRNIPFPNPKYQEKDLITAWKHLGKIDPNYKYLKKSTNSRVGDRVITHFHESIYSANVKGDISPHAAWYDDDLLKKVIMNRVIYINHLNPNKILQGFNISKIAPKVSVFSAGRAKLLIHKYLNDYQVVFDPFSGFSGRMLGTLALGKQYVGQDISEIHVRESNDIIEFLVANSCIERDIVTVTCRDILQSSGEYGCLFTCPPYGDKEQWLDVPVSRKSCDDWIDECLQRFKCNKYLFVVDKTEKYQKYIVETISTKSHLSKVKEYVILIW